MAEHQHNGRRRQHVSRGALMYVDDTEPDIIYGGQWGLNKWTPAYNGTFHFTRLSQTSITYRFTGSSIAVYGPVGVTAIYGAPVTTYQLDDSTPVTFTAPQVPGDDPLTNVLFFSADNLDATQHTLIIKRVNTDDAMYFFDFMQINPNAVPVPPKAPATAAAPVSSAEPTASTPAKVTFEAAQASASPQSSAVASAIPFSISEQPSPSEDSRVSAASPTSSAFASVDGPSGAGSLTLPLTGTGASSVDEPAPSDASDPVHKSTKTPYIAAGLVIGIAVLLAAIGIMFFLKIKRRRSQRAIVRPFDGRRPVISDMFADDGPIPHSAVFMLERGPASALHAASTESSVYSIAEKAAGIEGEESDGSDRITLPVSAHGFDGATRSPAVTPSRVTMHDTDAGIRLAGGSLDEAANTHEPILLPPAYSSTFRGSHSN